MQTDAIRRSERTFLVIDNELCFTSYGWFFSAAKFSIMTAKGPEVIYPYREQVEKVRPNWKSYSAHSEYFIDGRWHRRSAACGEVR